MPPTAAPQSTCPQCGAPVAAEAPEGLCTRCVASLCLQTDTAAGHADGRAVSAPLNPEDLAPNFPQLEILECLGRGGMGVVYKARQKSLNRLVALKLLAPERVTDSKFAQRFVHEAQALATLNHPNIVTVHEFGQTNGLYFLMMEFIDGVTLRQAMTAGRFTPEQALAIVPPVCEALQYAHEHGVVHRDIKPENLLIDKHGRVKIADFGIAKLLHSDGPESWFAESEVAGTPQYMAPEQKEHGEADNRADIYSLGVVLYELLTGELPADQLKHPLEQIKIDAPLHDLVRRALHANPEMRYQTAADMRTHFETILVAPGHPRPKARYSDVDAFGQLAGNHPPLLPRRLPRWPIITAAAAALAIGAFIYLKPATTPTGPALPAIVDSVDFNSGALKDAFYVNVQTGSDPYTLRPEIGLGGSRGVAQHNPDVSKDATLVYKAKGFDLSTLDSLEASCFVRKRALATVSGTGPLFIGLVGAKDGFLGGHNDKTTTEDAFLLVKIGMAEAPSASQPWRLIMQSKLGNTDAVVMPALGAEFTAGDGSWYHLRATFKRLDEKTIEVTGRVSNADAQGRVGSVIETIGPKSIAIEDLASDHQVWVALRGFGASGADVWDNFSIKANGVEAGPCAAPALNAIGMDAYRVPLVWTDNSTNEDSFILSRAASPEGPYVDLVKLAANTTSFTDRTSDRTQANHYRVRAVNSAADAPSEVLTVPAYESPYRWENVAIGGGGHIPGLHIHPSEPNLVYLRTGQGGLYRWDAEPSRWIPITEHFRMHERNWYGGEGIALDPRDPNVIYAACGRLAGEADGPGALFKSIDRGQHWRKLALEGVQMAARETRRASGERLVLSPHDSKLLLFGSRNHGLWRSADGGESWARVDSFPSSGLPLAGIVAVAFDPQTAGVVYVAAFGEGVFRSSDQGLSWTRLADSPDQVNRLTVSRSGVLLATHQFGVSRYAAGAWTATVPGGVVVPFGALTINPVDPGDVLVAEAESYSSKIYRSRDAGATWTRIEWTTTNTIPWNEGYAMSYIAAMEFDPTVPGRVWLTERNGIQRTENIDALPANFVNQPKGFEYLVVMALAASASGTPLLSGLTDTVGFRHDNGLEALPSRQMANPDGRAIDTYSIAVSDSDPLRVVRAVGNRTKDFQVLTSTDGGVTWAPTTWRTKFPKKIPMRIAISATDPNNFVVVMDSNGAQVTTDNGETWQDVRGLPGGGLGGPWIWTQPLAADRKLGGTFYYSDGKGTLLRSSNQGRSFERVNGAPLGSSGWFSVKTMPGKPGEVWICLEFGGLYRSTDGGMRFTAVPKVRRANLFAFGKPAPGRETPALYLLGRIGDSEDGIYQSLDLGETWTELTDPRVAIGDGPNVMEASAETFGLVFMGTNGRGVYMGRPKSDSADLTAPASRSGTTAPKGRPALRTPSLE